MTNPYYSPEDFGLSTIGEVEWSEPCYDFDLTVVWRDGAGQLYYADDSGCSCPVPFEDVRGVGDLTKATQHELKTHLDGRVNDYARQQVADLMRRVREMGR